MDRYEALIFPQLQKYNRAGVKLCGLAPNNNITHILLPKIYTHQVCCSFSQQHVQNAARKFILCVFAGRDVNGLDIYSMVTVDCC